LPALRPILLLAVAPSFLHLQAIPTERKRGEKLKVIVDSKRKGDKLIVNHTQFQEYLEQKLHDMTNFLSNVITALIILSVMVFIQTFKASDVYLYGLILLPLIARGFLYNRISANLHKKFAELLEL
jgi:hypothetical protein